MPDAGVNPFASTPTPALEKLLGSGDGFSFSAGLADTAGADWTFRRLDANLGLPGLPQSATGQTTLLTGRNAAEYMGAHHGPWPGPTLKRLLGEGNLFTEAAAAGRSATVANLYPPGYFRALEAGRLRVNAPVHAAMSSGVQLRNLDDYAAGRAVSADLSGDYVQQLLPGARRAGIEQSAADLAQLARTHDLTFFDFWLSDEVGHRGTMTDAERLVTRLDAFLGAVLREADRGGFTVLVTSDHGNLEDKSVRTHTRAPVPLLVRGPGADLFGSVSGLTGVAPAVRELLSL